MPSMAGLKNGKEGLGAVQPPPFANKMLCMTLLFLILGCALGVCAGSTRCQKHPLSCFVSTSIWLPEHPCQNHSNVRVRVHSMMRASMPKPRGPRDQRTTRPEDQRTTKPEDHGTRGPQDQRTTGPQDGRTTGRQDQRTAGPEDHRTKGPEPES